jgi:hypothetical protein
MSFLDFMKERGQAQPSVAQTSQEQDSVAQKPQTAKEMYTRESAQEQATRNPVEQMPDSAKQQAVEAAHPAAQLMDKATQHKEQSHDAPASPSDGKEALMHNQSAEGKTQEAMSPTDSHKGHRQERGRGMER